jgi:hypothetical protein
VNFSLSLPPELVKRLDGLRAEQSVSRSEVIRQLVEAGLGKPYPWPDQVARPPPANIVEARRHGHVFFGFNRHRS